MTVPEWFKRGKYAKDYKKLLMIKILGGKCSHQDCNYCNNFSAIQIHHKKGYKKMNLNTISLIEFYQNKYKFELLCANHHREKHNPNRKIDKEEIEKLKIPDFIMN